jgi:hypothetical protein
MTSRTGPIERAEAVGLRDRLFLATLGYLLVPNVIFVLGWLSPAWSIPISVVLAACMVDAWRRSTARGRAVSRRKWAFVAVFALFWTLAAGIGGLDHQVTDYFKHNLVFHDLVVDPWPVVYPRSAGRSLLCYYVAYYLPPGLAGKLLGLPATAAASFVWGLTGVALAFAWIARLGRRRGGVVLAVFMLVDGFGWLPGVYPFLRRFGLLAGGPPATGWGAGVSESFTSFGTPPIRLLFESEPRQLLWAPQHSIAAWLVTVCLLSVIEEQASPRYVGLVVAAALLWSPFVVVGALPFALVGLLRAPRSALALPGTLGAASIALPVGLYLHAHAPLQYAGFLPSLFSTPQDWLRYVFFLATSIGVLVVGAALVRRATGRPEAQEWRLFLFAAALLAALTLVYVGRFDDWAMRVAAPALLVFRLGVARIAVGLFDGGARVRTRLAFAALVLLSAERPIKITALSPLGMLPGQTCYTTIATATRAAPSLARLRGNADWDYASQYLGSPGGWFGLHVLGRLRPPAGRIGGP